MEYTAKNHSRDRAAESTIDPRKETGEWSRIISSQSPPYSAQLRLLTLNFRVSSRRGSYRKKSAKQAYKNRKEDDQQETKVAPLLPVA